MRKLILFVILSLLVGSSIPSFAQGEVTFAEVRVDLWPEYDRPDMLVIYYITLSPSVSLPVDVSILIPTSAGNPHAVANRYSNGELNNSSYSEQTLGEWTTVTINSTTPAIQLEYYDSDLTRNGNLRHYEYEWRSGIDVTNFQLHIQNPIGAENMKISPPYTRNETRSDGLQYYIVEVGGLNRDQSFTVSVDYEKTIEGNSVSELNVKTNQPINSSGKGSFTIAGFLPWILGGLGVSLLVGGSLWYWFTSKATTQTTSRSRSRRAAGYPHKSEIDDQYRYCPNCGNRNRGGDMYCRKCGSHLDSE